LDFLKIFFEATSNVAFTTPNVAPLALKAWHPAFLFLNLIIHRGSGRDQQRRRMTAMLALPFSCGPTFPCAALPPFLSPIEKELSHELQQYSHYVCPNRHQTRSQGTRW
jgi:hypothetical protein